MAAIVGQWDQMIAAMFGTMKDAMPSMEPPMQNRAAFEHLEMKAIQAGFDIVVGEIADYLAKLTNPEIEDE
ncbi:MAG: hypothetical protein ACLP9L_18400 [Thermoguttaceae bacterium]